MHVVGMLYGAKRAVDETIENMRSQPMMLPMINSKDGKKLTQWIHGEIRYLPFGVIEYVFPKENLDKVLTTLRCHLPDQRYNLTKLQLFPLRKMLRCKPIPKKFKTDIKFLWNMESVFFIPIGIREDGEIDEKIKMDEKFIDVRHEAI